MRAAMITQPDHLEITSLPDPVPMQGEIVIRVMASGICGTDIHIYRGEYLGAYPVIPGHEFSGVVEAVGEGVTRFRAGDRVAVEPNISCNNCEPCLHNRQNFCHNWQAVGVTRPGGMAERVAAPESAVFSIGGLPFTTAAFVEPLSCVLHGIERLGVHLADRVLICGAGPIGLLLLQICVLQGARSVTVVEKNPSRAAQSLALGAAEVMLSLEEIPRDAFDCLIDATGVPAVMARMLDFARPGGKVLLFGVPPNDAEMTVKPFQIFRKGLTLLSSFTSVRNTYQAVRLLEAGRLQVEALISHRLPLEQFEEGIHLIEQATAGVGKVMILPNG